MTLKRKPTEPQRPPCPALSGARGCLLGTLPWAFAPELVDLGWTELRRRIEEARWAYAM